MIRKWLAVLCLAGFLAAGCSKQDENHPGASGSGGTSAESISIAVIPKGTTHEYWKSVHSGADQAATELGVKIVWMGPLKENDRAGQISVVEQFVTEGVSGIVLAPLDDQALLRPVREAGSKNIPVVIIDSGLKGEAGKDFVSFVATDNFKGGQIGGEQLARLLNNKGNVVLLRYQEGSASTDLREKGFLDAISRHPDIKMLVDNRYGGATVDSAKTEAANMLDQLRQADGIFCPNESTTVAMLETLHQNNLAGKVKFVGFDASKTLVDGLENKEIDALVAQDPFRMGHDGVKTLVDHIRGKTVEPRIDTGVQLITRDNLDSPPIRELLKAR